MLTCWDPIDLPTCLLVKQEGNGPRDERATRAMKNYPSYHSLIGYVPLLLLGSGSYHFLLHRLDWNGVSILTTSEFRYDIEFEISNLSYPGIYVHIACFGGF